MHGQTDRPMSLEENTSDINKCINSGHDLFPLPYLCEKPHYSYRESHVEAMTLKSAHFDDFPLLQNDKQIQGHIQ